MTSDEVRPRLRAASSILGFICNIEARVVPSAAGKNSMKYANISNQIVWYAGLMKFIAKNTNVNATTMPGRAYPT